VGSAIAYNGATDRVLTLQANNNITVSQTIATSGGRLGVVLNADADGSGAGNVAINNSITTGGGVLAATGRNITANATGTISTAGAAGRAGGSVTLTASSAGAATIGKAITSAGGTAGAGTNGLAGGSVSVTGGTVTVAAVTASGSAGVGPGARAGGNGGAITLDANGATPTITLNGNLDARGGNGVNGGTGGAGGAVTALDPMLLTGNRSVLTSGGTGGTAAGGAVQLGTVDSSTAAARRTLTVTAGNAAVTLGNLGATNPLGTVNVSGIGIAAGSISTVGLANGAGAAVTLNAGTGASSVGAIDTRGGARTTNGAGPNGGAVTLTSNATTTGAITTRGANGLGGNNVGGNGGAVTMNGAGAASTIALNGAIDTRGGDSVGTGNTGNGGAVTLRATDAGSITGGAGATITTSGGRGQAGANVTVDRQAAGQTIASVALAGAINTSGGNGATDAAGRNAGNVAVNNARAIALASVTARGGNSGGANGVGGNGGTVSVTRAGTASAMTFSGVIDTRGGDSTGTGNTGNGGAVTIDAGAAPNVGTIAFLAGSGIDTRGGRGQTGGNVVVRDASSVAFDATATIDTSAGAGVTTGKNAGTVAMTAGITGPVTLGSVTTRGSAAVAANSVGGNGGNVAVTSVGATLLGGIDTRGGDGTGTAAGGTSGTIAINGGAGAVVSTSAGTLTTQGARGANGANVTIAATAAGSVNLAGAISAGGGAPATGQTGRTGGAASVTGGDVRVAAITTDGGAAATGNGGGAGAITLDANDATPTVTLAGALSARGGNAAGGTGGTGANITLGDPVRLAADIAIDVSAGTGGAPAGRNVSFQGTVDSENATPRALAVNAGGTTTFGGAVGATNALASVTTDAAGATAINGGSVRTTGAQTYNDNLSLGAATTLTTTAGGNVTAVGAVNAGGNALNLATGAGNATLTNAANNFATVGVANANDVALRDADAISFAAANVSGTLAVNAGGAITQTGAIVVGGAASIATGAATITLTDAGNDFQNAVTATNAGAGNAIALRDANDLTLAASSAGGAFGARAAGTLTLAGSVSAGAAGNAIVLEAGGNFDNSGGFLLNPGAGRWLVYSTNPALDNRGGLVYAFKQYNAPIGTAPLGAGNGFLYSVAPTIVPTLSGSATKVYDGTTAAPIGALVASPASGAIDGDTVSLAVAAATYADRNAGAGKGVTATGISVASATNGTAMVYGYQVSPATASAPVGTITQAPLTVTAQSDTRTYDGTTGSSVAPVVSGTLYDAIGTAPTQTYDNRNVGAGKTLTATGLVMADGNGGANYAVAYIADTTGVIDPATLTISAASEVKTYDGTTTAFASPTASGVQTGDSVTGLSQVFDSADAGPRTLSVSAYTVSDGNGGNNYLVVTNTAAGTINPAALTIAADNASRPYGDANPPLSATFTGLVPGDAPADIAGLAITTPAVPASSVGAYAINAAGGVNANYAISYVPGTLTIVAAPLTVSANDATRPEAAPNPPFSATASGFKLGQGLADLAGTLAFFTPANMASPAGLYPIVPSGVSSPNYAVVFVNGTLTVTSAVTPIPPPVPPSGELAADTQAYIAGLQDAARFAAAEEDRERRRERRGLDCIELERANGARRVLFTCY
ncbi:MAG: YDG domain-containing protein, partial [Burkholderiales bacterium]|nr:YDG domain-containing protein [Burkholderiales bacterium]